MLKKKQIYLVFLIAVFYISCNKSENDAINIEISKWPDDAQSAISFPFDDNCPEHFLLIAPELEKYGWRGSFAVNASFYKDNEAWRSTAQRGHEIVNHTFSHKRLTNMSNDEIYNEIYVNYNLIETRLGVKPIIGAYPFGQGNENIEKIFKIKHLCTRNKFVKKFTEILLTSKDTIRINKITNKILKSIEKESYCSIVGHGIGTDEQCSMGYSPVSMKYWLQIFDYIKDYNDKNDRKIWVAPIGEIVKYRLLYENTTIIYDSVNNHETWFEAVFNSPTNLISEAKSILTIQITSCKTIKSVEYLPDKNHINFIKKDTYYLANIKPNVKIKITI